MDHANLKTRPEQDAFFLKCLTNLIKTHKGTDHVCLLIENDEPLAGHWSMLAMNLLKRISHPGRLSISTSWNAFSERKTEKDRVRHSVSTNRYNKPKYSELLQCLLRDKQLCYSSAITTISSGGKQKGILEAHNPIDTLIDQMANYKMEIRMQRNDPTLPSKTVYSGKSGGNNDDLVCALMLGLFHAHRLYKLFPRACIIDDVDDDIDPDQYKKQRI